MLYSGLDDYWVIKLVAAAFFSLTMLQFFYQFLDFMAHLLLNVKGYSTAFFSEKG